MKILTEKFIKMDKIKKLKRIFETWSEDSTVHGITHLNKSNSLVRKSIWTSAIIASAIYCIYCTFILYLNFFSFYSKSSYDVLKFSNA